MTTRVRIEKNSLFLFMPLKEWKKFPSHPLNSLLKLGSWWRMIATSSRNAAAARYITIPRHHVASLGILFTITSYQTCGLHMDLRAPCIKDDLAHVCVSRTHRCSVWRPLRWSNNWVFCGFFFFSSQIQVQVDSIWCLGTLSDVKKRYRARTRFLNTVGKPRLTFCLSLLDPSIFTRPIQNQNV